MLEKAFLGKVLFVKIGPWKAFKGLFREGLIGIKGPLEGFQRPF